MRQAVRNPGGLSRASATSAPWLASSRVGQRTKATVRRWSSSRAHSSTIGITKAAVLPLPVGACTSASRPASSGGMASACTGVGSVIPILRSPASVGALRFSASNVSVKHCLLVLEFGVGFAGPQRSPATGGAQGTLETHARSHQTVIREPYHESGLATPRGLRASALVSVRARQYLAL